MNTSTLIFCGVLFVFAVTCAINAILHWRDIAESEREYWKHWEPPQERKP
jgi:hypothetical protein